MKGQHVVQSLLLALTCVLGVVAVAAATEPKFELVNVSSTISETNAFFGAATAGDGRVVFAPFDAHGVGVFDPTDDGFTFVPIPYFGGQKFASARDCERRTGGIRPI